MDQNPLEWPDQSVLEYNKNSSDPQVMADWIRNLQMWLEEHASSAGERKHSDDSISSDVGNDSSLSL